MFAFKSSYKILTIFKILSICVSKKNQGQGQGQGQEQGQGQRQRKTPLILDVSNVYPKITTDDREQDWIRGEIIGFCEVMERGRRPPILTNLSVRADARDCRIGSKLVEACEDAVVVDFGDKEIFLEVESDNVKALQFYHRRGYQVVLGSFLMSLGMRPTRRGREVSRLYQKTSPLARGFISYVPARHCGHTTPAR